MLLSVVIITNNATNSKVCAGINKIFDDYSDHNYLDVYACHKYEYMEHHSEPEDLHWTKSIELTFNFIVSICHKHYENIQELRICLTCESDHELRWLDYQSKFYKQMVFIKPKVINSKPYREGQETNDPRWSIICGDELPGIVPPKDHYDPTYIIMSRVEITT